MPAKHQSEKLPGSPESARRISPIPPPPAPHRPHPTPSTARTDGTPGPHRRKQHPGNQSMPQTPEVLPISYIFYIKKPTKLQNSQPDTYINMKQNIKTKKTHTKQTTLLDPSCLAVDANSTRKKNIHHPPDLYYDETIKKMTCIIRNSLHWGHS